MCYAHSMVDLQCACRIGMLHGHQASQMPWGPRHMLSLLPLASSDLLPPLFSLLHMSADHICCPQPCNERSGTQFQVALALYTQKGGLKSVEYTLKAMMAWPEKNLCRSKDIQIGCTQEGAGLLRLANVWVKTGGSAKAQRAAAAADAEMD